MDRRAFLGALALLAGARNAVAQQTERVYRIGHLSLMAPDGMAPYVASLESGLRDLGYVKGRNFVLEDRSANGDPKALPAAAADLVRLNVDVIVTGANSGVAALKQVTRTTPIVMVWGLDPVGAGFIKSLARPGTNVTGGTFEAAPDIYGKKLELLKMISPMITNVAFLWNPTFPGGPACLEATRQAGQRLRVQVQSIETTVPGELDAAFAKITKARAQAIIVLSDPILFPLRAQIAKIAVSRRLAVAGASIEFADAGALMSYGPNGLERWKHAAIYVDKLLKGIAVASELPVEQPTKFELVINLKTAKALGLTIPPSLLARADQVIE